MQKILQRFDMRLVCEEEDHICCGGEVRHVWLFLAWRRLSGALLVAFHPISHQAILWNYYVGYAGFVG
jgi:hypothetical protein